MDIQFYLYSDMYHMYKKNYDDIYTNLYICQMYETIILVLHMLVNIWYEWFKQMYQMCTDQIYPELN